MKDDGGGGGHEDEEGDDSMEVSMIVSDTRSTWRSWRSIAIVAIMYLGNMLYVFAARRRRHAQEHQRH